MGAKELCPTCMGSVRETVNMVCQTCGTDYSEPHPLTPQQRREATSRLLELILDKGQAETLAEAWLAEEIQKLRDLLDEIRALADLDIDSIFRKPDTKTVRITEQKDGYTVTSSFVRIEDLRKILENEGRDG